MYFSLASVASGLPITGASGAISGRRSIDGGAQTLLSGFIGEVGGGQYVCNLFAEDTNGNNVGFLFTASGAGMVNYTLLTLGGVSGGIYLASGSVTSGVICSGVFVTVPPATLSGIQPISGTFVSVPISSISGVQPVSGATVTVPIASVSGLTANSGLFVNAAPVASGQVWLASGAYAVEIPKGVLTYDFSGAPNVSGQRDLLNAARKLINKWSLTDASGYLRVYAEDDATVAYDQAFTSVSGGQTLSSLDTK